MKVRRYFIFIYFTVKNIPNKNILEFTYIDIKISFEVHSRLRRCQQKDFLKIGLTII